MRAEVDHVVVGVADLDDASARLTGLGLTVLPGGTHPHWGTANRIVPLGSSYLELVAVVDAGVAAGSAFGSWVAAQARGEAAWGWAVRPPAIDATAERLGLDVVPGSRVRADGVTLSWRLAGVPDGQRDPSLPFFIAWGDGVPLPGQASAEHEGGRAHLGSLVVASDAVALRAWLDDDVDKVTVVAPGDAGTGVLEVVVVAPAGSLVLVPADLA